MSLLYEVRGLVRRYGRVTALDLPALGVKSIWRTPLKKRRRWRFTVWRSSWAATSKPPSGSLPKDEGISKNRFIN